MSNKIAMQTLDFVLAVILTLVLLCMWLTLAVVGAMATVAIGNWGWSLF